MNKHLFEKVITWTENKDFWVRRASAVVLIPAISKKDYEGIDPLSIVDALLLDKHDLVLKGYGWMLKVLSQADQYQASLRTMRKCLGYRFVMPVKSSIRKLESG